MSFIFLVACPFFLLATRVGDLMSEEDWWPRGVPRIGAGGGLILLLVLLHFSLRRDGPKESDLDEAVRLIAYSAGKLSALAELLALSRAGIA